MFEGVKSWTLLLLHVELVKDVEDGRSARADGFLLHDG